MHGKRKYADCCCNSCLLNWLPTLQSQWFKWTVDKLIIASNENNRKLTHTLKIRNTIQNQHLNNVSVIATKYILHYHYVTMLYVFIPLRPHLSLLLRLSAGHISFKKKFNYFQLYAKTTNDRMPPDVLWISTRLLV